MRSLLITAVMFATWGPAVAEVLEVRSGDTILGLDATGAPVRLADVRNALELAGGDQELFRLVVIPPGADPERSVELSSRDAQAVKRIEGDGLRLRFEEIGNRNLAAVCVVDAGTDGLLRFRITLEGQAGVIVERVDYPLLPLAAPLEADGGGDELVLGTTKGGVLQRPHQWQPGRSAAGTQPGNLAAQFGCYYGPKGGVVTYCEDDAGHPKTLAATRTAGGMVLAWRHLMRHDLKEPLCLAFPGVAGVCVVGAGTRGNLKRLVPVNALVLVLFVLLALQSYMRGQFEANPNSSVPVAGGETSLAMVGPLPAVEDGRRLALVIGLKANAIVLSVVVLLAGLDSVTLGHALGHLKMPQKLIHLLLFTVRYLDVLDREFVRLRAAMKVRGFRPRVNWHTYRTIGHLIGMLLVRSLDRSERVVAAMKCRGFRGRFYLLDHFAFSARDIAFTALVLASVSLLAALECL